MSVILRIMLFLGVLSLSGCFPPPAPKYQQPTQQPVASLSFMPTSALTSTTATIYSDGDNCKQPGVLPPLMFMKNQTIKIPANRELALELTWVTVESSCDIIISFSPQVNQKYLLYFDADDSKCHAAIGKMSNQNIIPVQIHKRESNYWQITKDQPRCSPLK